MPGLGIWSCREGSVLNSSCRVIALVLSFLLVPVAVAEPLKVGVRETPPFAEKQSDGQWKGISVDLFEQVASEMGLEYELVSQPLLEPMFSALGNGELDAAIGALTVTSEREELIDFSHAFFNSGVGIASQQENGSMLGAARALISPGFLSAVGALGLLLLVVGLLIWLVERKHNPQFPGNAATGIGDGFWWSAVTMTTVGYGDKAPVTFAGRVLGVIWMFVGIITISGFTAAMTSNLTLQNLQGRVQGPEDLPKVRVVSVAGSTAAALLDSRGIRFKSEPDAASALALLNAGEVDAVVYDRPVLRYLIHSGEMSQLHLLPQDLVEESYAIGLPPGSPLREEINRRMLELRAKPQWTDTLERYLGA
tara:strand:- start:3027 stop:4124 length:1098 start_codon:yes stop_codon:yes gene_type:complete